MDAKQLANRARSSIDYRTKGPRDRLLRALLPAVFPAARGRRFRAHLPNVHSEWSIVHSPTADLHPASDDLIGLALAAVDRARTTDLSAIAARTPDPEEKGNVTRWPGEHYRLLHALAEVWGAKMVAEIGTSTGVSALTFRSVPSVERVVTFDIFPWTYFPATALAADDLSHGAAPGIHQVIGDLAEADVFDLHRGALAGADLIFIDGPKNGVFEPRFFQRLWAESPTRRQLLVIDDIRVVSMVELWQNLPIAKLDVTSFGHWSGTGLAIREPAG